MLAWYPWVPIGGLMGINCAILTYNGTAYFGFTGDVHAAPDLVRLESFLRLGFEEMVRAAGGRTPRNKKSARRKARVVSTPAPVAAVLESASSRSSFGRTGKSTRSVN